MKRSAFPLLLACWTAPFLATSNCSSVTKLPTDSGPGGRRAILRRNNADVTRCDERMRIERALPRKVRVAENGPEEICGKKDASFRKTLP